MKDKELARMLGITPNAVYLMGKNDPVRKELLKHAAEEFMRTTYVIDYIKWELGEGGFCIPADYKERERKGEGWSAICMADSQRDRLLNEATRSGVEMIYCPYSVKLMIASGATFFEHFPTFEEGKDYIEKLLSEGAMFNHCTHTDLLERYPKVKRVSKELWDALGR